MDYEAVLQVIETNLLSSNQRESGKLGISQSSVVSVEMQNYAETITKNIAKLLTHPSKNKL